MFESRMPTAEQIARLEDMFERRCPSSTPESVDLLERVRVASRLENRAAASV